MFFFVIVGSRLGTLSWSEALADVITSTWIRHDIDTGFVQRPPRPARDVFPQPAPKIRRPATEGRIISGGFRPLYHFSRYIVLIASACLSLIELKMIRDENGNVPRFSGTLIGDEPCYPEPTPLIDEPWRTSRLSYTRHSCNARSRIVRLSVSAKKATIPPNYAADAFLRPLPRLPSPRARAALAKSGAGAAQACDRAPHRPAIRRPHQSARAATLEQAPPQRNSARGKSVAWTQPRLHP